MNEMYSQKQDIKSNNRTNEKFLLKGKATNNALIEVGTDLINLSTHEYSRFLEKQIDKQRKKIKSLEDMVNRMVIEHNKLRNEVNSLKQYLNRT